MNFSQLFLLLQNSKKVSNLWPSDAYDLWPGEWQSRAQTLRLEDFTPSMLAALDKQPGSWEWGAALARLKAKYEGTGV